jgi:hypothetical protein
MTDARAAHDDLRAKSDAELVAATRPLDGAFGCYLWLILPATAAIGAMYWGAAGALLGALAALGIARVALRLRSRAPHVRRARLAEREYCARYQIDSLGDAESEALALLREPGPVEAVILLRAHSLPRGGHRFVRVEFGHAPRITLRATPWLADLRRFPDELSRTRKLDLSLTSAQIEPLQRLVSQLTAADLTSPASEVLDGMPCEVCVLRRGSEPLHASMNYAFRSARITTLASMRLLTLVFDLVTQVAPTQRRTPRP